MIAQCTAVAAFEIRALLRRRRTAVSLLLYLICVGFFLATVNHLRQKFDAMLSVKGVSYSEVYQTLEKILGEIGISSPQQTETILAFVSKWPAPVWLFQIFSVAALPTLIALVSSDAVAIDLYRRTLRFVVLKCSRSAYILGKIAAHCVLYLTVHSISTALLLYSVDLQQENGRPGDLVFSVGVSFICFIPFVITAVALTVWISTWFSRPSVATIVAHAVWLAALTLILYAPVLTPLNPELLVGLFFPLAGYGMQTIVGYLLWSVLLIAASALTFRRREV